MKAIFSMNRFEGWNLSLPLIQGGMGVGVSLSSLAGSVASEGGMGVISTAQIGFERNGGSQRHGGITAIQGAC